MQVETTALGTLSMAGGGLILVCVIVLFLQWQGVKSALDAFCLTVVGVLAMMAANEVVMAPLGPLEPQMEALGIEFARGWLSGSAHAFVLILAVPWIRWLIVRGAEQASQTKRKAHQVLAVALLLAAPMLASELAKEMLRDTDIPATTIEIGMEASREVLDRLP